MLPIMRNENSVGELLLETDIRATLRRLAGLIVVRCNEVDSSASVLSRFIGLGLGSISIANETYLAKQKLETVV